MLFRSGSATNPVDFAIDQVDLSFGIRGIPGITDGFNVVIHYIWPTAFSFAGIDLLPGLQALAAVFVLVTIVRQLQER